MVNVETGGRKNKMSADKTKISTRQFEDTFSEYWKERISRFSLSNLVFYANSISKFIDNGFVENFILADEIIVLHELIRDECVHRCNLMSESRNISERKR